MRRILVPLDGSRLAESILPVAEEWAKEDEAEVILLRAVPADQEMGLEDAKAPVRVPEAAAAEKEAEIYLKGIADRLERRGVKRVRWVVLAAEPAQAIRSAAAGKAVDFIAMATHGRGGLSRLLLGSVAEAVVRSVRTPVLLIRGQSAWKPWTHRRILVPLDGSQTSAAILPLVEQVAGPRDLAISLLQIIEPVPSPARAETSLGLEEMIALRRADAERYLVKVAEALWDKGLRADWKVGYGTPAATIAALAEEERVDLIAMATHGRTGLGRLFFGSVAEGVLRAASIPVLLFKAGRG